MTPLYTRVGWTRCVGELMKNQFHKNSCSWTSNQPEWEDETNSGLYGSTPRLRRQNLNCFNISQNSLIEKIERHTCKKK